MKLSEIPAEQIQTAMEKWRFEDNLQETIEAMQRQISMLNSIVCMLAEAERYRIEKARKK